MIRAPLLHKGGWKLLQIYYGPFSSNIFQPQSQTKNRIPEPHEGFLGTGTICPSLGTGSEVRTLGRFLMVDDSFRSFRKKKYSRGSWCKHHLVAKRVQNDSISVWFHWVITNLSSTSTWIKFGKQNCQMVSFLQGNIVNQQWESWLWAAPSVFTLA